MKAILVAVTLASASFTSAAVAQTIAALSGGDTLVHIDAKAKKVVKTVKLTGVAALVGIDVRPADGMLYGLASDGAIVTIDPATGKATQKSKMDAMLPAGVMATVDFNPAADRLRVMSNSGMNLRVNVDDGKAIKDGDLKFADKDMHKGEKPNVIAGAYTNSVKGAKATTLYDIDGTLGALLKQAPPNDGVLGAIGKLGVTGSSWAFDIHSTGEGQNNAWLLGDATLYTVNLDTGKATPVGKIADLENKIMDIAILP